ncbi:MAG: acetyl-CoA carboxylase biotin carboxyl carrier protein [Rhodobiaceae bacterium]|jgi:acetyl-CoA carboxylase biotin carboxyl carrier protein|nr:acetyl-CoA carboxylase biotin carboxyl carrier protein [Rhodobiaceae bacterium]MBT5517790.1 acetyl-CoA carboxylase biotin carboxyl carrier protein [Rhodobiaceae bacterium]
MAKLPDKKTIKELADLLADTGLSEIEVETGEVRIRVARQSAAVNAVMPAAAPVAMAAPAPATPAPAAAEAPAASDLAGALKSPMVGTAYLSPEPGAANFVKVGDTVSQGQTLLIVEAMKTMNPIAATKAGKITQIIVGNEQPVEFDEVLMIIE